MGRQTGETTETADSAGSAVMNFQPGRTRAIEVLSKRAQRRTGFPAFRSGEEVRSENPTSGWSNSCADWLAVYGVSLRAPA